MSVTTEGTYPKYKKIDGHYVRSQFLVLHKGWEMDNWGWVTDDGRVWLTSHGVNPYRASLAELAGALVDATSAVDGLKRAIADGDWT